MSPRFIPALRASILGATLALFALAATGNAVAAEPGVAPIAIPESIREQAQQDQWAEALLLIEDDARSNGPERALPPLHVLEETEYLARMAARSERLGNLKADILHQTGRPDALEELRDYPVLPVMHVRVRSPQVLERLARNPRVKAIDEIIQLHTTLAESLPLIAQPEAATLGHTGTGTAVCILDTGVEYTRDAFGDCTVGDDGQPEGENCRVAYVEDFAPDDGQLDDGTLHGTNVSAIALGVAPDTDIIGLDVFDGSQASSADIIAAMDWCITNRATYNIASINLSLGDGSRHPAPVPTDGSAWGQTITESRAAGIAVVAASGNSGFVDGISLPAAFEGVISVGAVYDSNVGGLDWGSCQDLTTEADQVTCFSNSADYLTMLAPGALITAAEVTMGGTSQAAPHVAGASAVLRQVFPGDSVDDQTERLTANGVLLQDDRNGVITPRLDLEQASTSTLHTLTVTTTGDGTVVSNPAGIDCGPDCSVNLNVGTEVTLTALPLLGGAFEGWGGACSGTAATCTLTLTGDLSASAQFAAATFPPSGGLGAGWSEPAGSAAPWFTTDTTSYTGTHSLQAGDITHDQVSRLAYTGVFEAGTVGFARRVSSEYGWDFLNFYIDGTLAGRWSGERDWSTVTFPISAGEHTLLWEYAKDEVVSHGADTAWIDAVSLPLQPTPGTLQLTTESATVADTIGSITLTVTRANGSDEEAGVFYATQDGSAEAGVDYTSAGGNFSWGDGDASDRTITIAILADSPSSGQRTFSLDLSGASGATLGTPASTGITINDSQGTTCELDFPTHLTLSGIVTGSAQRTACQSLQTGTYGFTVETNASVQFRAGTGIRLGPGFRVQPGATFSATVDSSLTP